MLSIIHHQFNEHFCSEVIEGKKCNGKIVQTEESVKNFPDHRRIRGPGAWTSGQMIVKTFCTKCGKGYPKLNYGPL